MTTSRRYPPEVSERWVRLVSRTREGSSVSVVGVLLGQQQLFAGDAPWLAEYVGPMFVSSTRSSCQLIQGRSKKWPLSHDAWLSAPRPIAVRQPGRPERRGCPQVRVAPPRLYEGLGRLVPLRLPEGWSSIASPRSRSQPPKVTHPYDQSDHVNSAIQARRSKVWCRSRIPQV